MPSETTAADVVTAEVVETEVSVEVVETEAVGAATQTPTPIPNNKPRRLGELPSTRGQSIRIFQQASGPGVESISNTGEMLIFVQNQLPVHGKMFSSQEIETVTSSVQILSC